MLDSDYGGVMRNQQPVAPFISIDALDQLPEPVILADARWYLDSRSGRAAYEQGHLPDAVFVDLDCWLSGPATLEGGRNPLPEPEVFSEGMASLGIGDDHTVVAYDDAGGVIAARLVWMLRAAGRRAAGLDGGMAGFEELSYPGVLAVDARNRDRFEGAQDPVDPRPGHVPGAANVPCRENLD